MKNKKLLAVMGFALMLVASTAKAMEFSMGQTYAVQAPVCLEKADAIDVAKTMVEQGLDAGIANFSTKEKCAVLPMEAKFKKVVFVGQVGQAEIKVIAVEVELQDGSVKEVYVLTDQPVKGMRST